jgi:acyl-CoA synthetase (AMP-forming)/AMP-acid ligase II
MSTLPAKAIQRTEESGPLTAEGLLRRRARQRPGATALSDPPNLPALGFGRPKSLTYREADDAVDALASFFIELGLEPGDRIAVQLPNLVLQPLTLLAAWRAGLTVAALPMLLQIPGQASGGKADPARCRRPRSARADLEAGVTPNVTPPASPRRRS